MAKKKQVKKSFTDLIKDSLKLSKNNIVNIGDSKEKTVIKEIGEINEDGEVDLCKLLGKEHTHIYIRNIEFNAPQDVSLVGYYDQFIHFDNCVFNDNVTIVTGDVAFTKCKFHHEVSTTMISGVGLSGHIGFDSCQHFNNDVRIYNADNVSIKNCKDIDLLRMEGIHYNVIVEKTQLQACKFVDCIFNHIDLCNVKFTNFSLHGCCVENLKVANSNIDEIFFYNTIINGDVKLVMSTIGQLYTNRATVFGDFRVTGTTVGQYDCNFTVGIHPPSNDIILYKKCTGCLCNIKLADDEDISNGYEEVIVKLSVPAKAKRVYCNNLKIRVSEATVLEFYKKDGSKYKLKKGWHVRSMHDNKFEYRIGATVKPKEAFDPTSGTCGSGIHGFINFNDAVKY